MNFDELDGSYSMVNILLDYRKLLFIAFHSMRGIA